MKTPREHFEAFAKDALEGASESQLRTLEIAFYMGMIATLEDVSRLPLKSPALTAFGTKRVADVYAQIMLLNPKAPWNTEKR